MIKTALEMLVDAGHMDRGVALSLTPILVDDGIEWHNRMVDAGRSVKDMVVGMVIRPPWDHTWLDSPVLQEDESGPELGIRIGMEIFHGEADHIFRSWMMLAKKHGTTLPRDTPSIPPHAKKAVTISLLLVGHNRKPGWMGSILAWCDIEWRRTSDPYLMLCKYRPIEPELNKWATITTHMLGLFHVKNATLVDATNRAYRRQAAIRGGIGLKVKELVIAPLRETLHRMRDSERLNPGQPLPLHLCRGHFKTFTAERPLMGRLTGTFWWEPHLRGSEHMGIVVNNRAVLQID